MHKINWLFFLKKDGFGGGGNPPAVQAPPSPTPSPTPQTPNPVATATDRAATLKKLQYGLTSTVSAGQTAGVPSLKPIAAVGGGTATTLGGV